MFAPTLRSLLLWGAVAQTSASAIGQQHPLVHTPEHAPNKPLSKQPAAPASASTPSYRDALLDLHKTLISIPSVSGAETDVGIALRDILVNLGYRTALQTVPPGENTPAGTERYNVVAWPGGSDDDGDNKSNKHERTTRSPQPTRPRVLVTSHIDVVPPYIPYSLRNPDGSSNATITAETLIAGRGSVDAKASVAAQIVAVQELLATTTSSQVAPEDLVLLFVVSEESTGNGMKHFSSHRAELGLDHGFDAAVFGEPTELRLACGHKGIGLGSISAVGKAGHSGYPWLGKSANEVLIRALGRILDADFGRSDRFGNTTVNVGMIEGGVAANVIPKHASAKLGIRMAAGTQADGAERVRKAIEDILEHVDAEALTLHWTGGYGPVECDCDVDGKCSIVNRVGSDVCTDVLVAQVSRP